MITVTTTGVAFLFSSAGLAFCGLRFFEAFKSAGSSGNGQRTGMLLSSYYILTSFQHLLLAFAGIFFATNQNVFLIILSTNNLLLSFIAALGVYAVFYVVYPSSSPWISVGVTLIIGAILFFLTLYEYSPPEIISGNSLDWNISRSTALALIYISVIAIGAPLIIFLKNIKYSTGSVRRIFVVLSILQIMGMINVLYLFGGSLYSAGYYASHFFDKLLIFIGLVFIFVFFVQPMIDRGK